MRSKILVGLKTFGLNPVTVLSHTYLGDFHYI